jgi:hypothetical protein
MLLLAAFLYRIMLQVDVNRHKTEGHPAVSRSGRFFGKFVTKSVVHVNVPIYDEAHEIPSFLTVYVLRYDAVRLWGADQTGNAGLPPPPPPIPFSEILANASSVTHFVLLSELSFYYIVL